MSLKAFHIFFIAMSVLLCIGFGVWEFVAYAQSGDVPQLLLGITSLLVAGGLIVYGIRFLRKLKNIGYL